MIRFFFLFTFLSCSFSLQSQSVKKAFKLYEKRDLLKFEETLEKMDEKSIESSGKYFLYSLLYLENLESRSSIDSSYLLINKSKEIYPNEFSKVFFPSPSYTTGRPSLFVYSKTLSLKFSLL